MHGRWSSAGGRVGDKRTSGASSGMLDLLGGGRGMARVKVGRVSLGQVEKPAISSSDVMDDQKAVVSKLFFFSHPSDSGAKFREQTV